MESPSGIAERLRRVEQDYKRNRNLILIVLAMSLFVQAYIWCIVIGPARPANPLMEFEQARIDGVTALCPGETLTYTVDLVVNRPGVFDIDVSVWRENPPATVIFSSTRRAVLDTPITYKLPRSWTVPDTYLDPTTNQPVAWLPGKYERRHAISAVGQVADPTLVSFPFTIREDCR